MFLGPLLLINFTSFELCFHLCPPLSLCVRTHVFRIYAEMMIRYFFVPPPPFCHLSGLTIVITFKQVETDIRIFSLHSSVGS